MQSTSCASLLADTKSRRLCLFSLLPTVSLLCLVFFIGSAFIEPQEKLSKWGMADNMQNAKANTCMNQCRPYGSEALPRGIVSRTSNLEMRPLWGTRRIRGVESKKHTYSEKISSSTNLFAVAVGIRQKEYVNKMVKRFLSSGFIVMLFHYDGIVDEWKDLKWNDRVIHVSAINQTKWWFAKRFLHPEIVADYDYVFLWDEDLGVENFHPKRYLSIIKSEGLEISQPALDPVKSEVHHQITARGRRSNVHRRIYKPGASGKGCDKNSRAPPCTGWIEVMAPVFSKAAWRCVWHMIQNDLVHAWGLDMQLGYCAQGDRTKNVGVVDSEYIVHYGFPTLGGIAENKTILATHNHNSEAKNMPSVKELGSLESHANDNRVSVRRQSYMELEIFKKRWKKAVQDDKCWSDPYKTPAKQSI
ncbi:uncharacterized protein LOC131154158 isoform X2 [Malania oleifera]|uniref:uncharacterized protein LOC131154158 isoform X2 n=1 Tax=Malania oleifera TaxID=397392 RepID=UPI0025AE2310|nr:uncharacterized protein LOC131154158 isoform X2 [Malania oleifera]